MDRHTHRVDGIQWDGHGVKFPGSRRLRSNMVSAGVDEPGILVEEYGS